jgi:DNA-binding MarR family transcriptional regulator
VPFKQEWRQLSANEGDQCQNVAYVTMLVSARMCQPFLVPPSSLAKNKSAYVSAAHTPDTRIAARRKVILRTADSPYYQLWVLSNLTAKPFPKFAAEFDLNLTAWRVLLTIADRPGITAQELSDYSGLDKMIVSRAVRGLEDQGRLVREGSDADRRMRHLSLTDHGWKVYAKVAPAAVAREAQIYEQLSPRELATLRRLLKKLSRQARASADPPNGQQKPYSSASSASSLQAGPSAHASSVQP